VDDKLKLTLLFQCVEKLVSRTRIHLNQEREKLGLKRRKSLELDSPISVKHTFCHHSMENCRIGEKYPRSLSYSCRDLTKPLEEEWSFMKFDFLETGRLPFKAVNFGD